MIIHSLTLYTWGENQWKRSMEEKSNYFEVVAIELIMKLGTKEESMFDHAHVFVLLFRARTSSLQLNWKKTIVSEEVFCQICQKEQTLNHFLRWCPGLEWIRTQYGVNGGRYRYEDSVAVGREKRCCCLQAVSYKYCSYGENGKVQESKWKENKIERLYSYREP